MSNIVKFENLKGKLIKYKNEFVLIDSDVAELYGVETREINQAVSNNLNKFPQGYIIELTDDEKQEVIKNFDHLSKLKFSPHLPKIFTEKGLYMLATILKGEVAIETTIKIIETFANVRELSRNLNTIDENQTQEEQQALILRSNELLEKVIDIEPVTKLKDDETEVETKIELNLGLAKVSRSIKKIKKEQK